MADKAPSVRFHWESKCVKCRTLRMCALVRLPKERRFRKVCMDCLPAKAEPGRRRIGQFMHVSVSPKQIAWVDKRKNPGRSEAVRTVIPKAAR